MGCLASKAAPAVGSEAGFGPPAVGSEVDEKPVGLGITSEAREALPARDWRRIICPVISAWYTAGDLIPDENGEVTEEQFRDLLVRSGIAPAVIEEVIGGNQPMPINVFEMNGRSAYEHDVSTGTRDPGPPNEAAWGEFAAFARDEVTPETIQAMGTHFTKTQSNNDRNAEKPAGVIFGAWGLLLNVFGDDNAGAMKGTVMKLAHMRQMVMESLYPPGYKLDPP